MSVGGAGVDMVTGAISIGFLIPVEDDRETEVESCGVSTMTGVARGDPWTEGSRRSYCGLNLGSLGDVADSSEERSCKPAGRAVAKTSGGSLDETVSPVIKGSAEVTMGGRACEGRW